MVHNSWRGTLRSFRRPSRKPLLRSEATPTTVSRIAASKPMLPERAVVAIFAVRQGRSMARSKQIIEFSIGL